VELVAALCKNHHERITVARLKKKKKKKKKKKMNKKRKKEKHFGHLVTFWYFRDAF